MGIDKFLGIAEEALGRGVPNSVRDDFYATAANAPLDRWSRRRFLGVAAAAAAAATGLEARAEVDEERTVTVARAAPSRSSGVDASSWDNLRIRPDWEQVLLREDHIHGPGVHISQGGTPMDWEGHRAQASRLGIEYFGHDYGVPTGLPVTLQISGATRPHIATGNGALVVNTEYRAEQRDRRGRELQVWSNLGHLDGYSNNINPEFLDISDGKRVETLNNLQIVGATGSSGTPSPHLHASILMMERVNRRWVPEYPGIDPNTIGPQYVGGGRPIYNPGEDNFLPYGPDHERWLVTSAIGMRDRWKRVSPEEVGLEPETLRAIQERFDDPGNLGPVRDFLAHEVLRKHSDGSGRENYKHLPGTDIYALTFDIMPRAQVFGVVPFPSPHLADTYRKANSKDPAYQKGKDPLMFAGVAL